MHKSALIAAAVTACSGSPRAVTTANAPTTEARRVQDQAVPCAAVTPDLDVTVAIYSGSSVVIVRCGRNVLFATPPALEAGHDVAFDDSGPELHSPEEAVRDARRLLGADTYDVIIAFPDATTYAERLLRSKAWSDGARRLRIGAAAQIASLGEVQRDALVDPERTLLTLVVEHGRTSASVVEAGQKVTEVEASFGAANVPDAMARVVQHGPRPQLAILSGSASSDNDRREVNDALGAAATVEVRADLVARGLLVQVGILQGRVKDQLLLVQTPDTELGIARVRRPTAPAVAPFSAISANNVLAFDVSQHPNTTIPTRATLAASSDPDVDLWLSERTGTTVTAIRRIDQASGGGKIQVDIDADMIVTTTMPKP